MSQPLQEYARDRDVAGTRCLVCKAPDAVRNAVEENGSAPLRKRLPRPIVVAWAREEHGVRITPDSIYKHMRDHI